MKTSNNKCTNFKLILYSRGEKKYQITFKYTSIKYYKLFRAGKIMQGIQNFLKLKLSTVGNNKRTVFFTTITKHFKGCELKYQTINARILCAIMQRFQRFSYNAQNTRSIGEMLFEERSF